MPATSDPGPPAAERRRAPVGAHVALWSLLALVPAVKTWQVIADDPPLHDWMRQVAVVVVVFGAVWFVVPRRGVAAGLGLWPDRPLPAGAAKAPVGLRWAIAVVAAGAAVAACTTAAEGPLRWVLTSVAAACLGGLVAWEVMRLVSWRRDLWRAAQPRQLTWWVAGPVALSGIATAVALGARGDRSLLDMPTLAELALLTALGEEFVFRGGLLLIAYRVCPPRLADVVVSLSFGCWHIGDTWVGSRGHVAGSRTAEIAGTVLATFVAGLFFVYVRKRTRSLAGPTLAHIATNMPGIALVA